MRSPSIFAILTAALVSGSVAQDATVVTDGVFGTVYKALLPSSPFFEGADLQGNVKGSVTASVPLGGKGVRYVVEFENFPTEGGPFTYHVHENAATDGNCTAAGAHLDPFNRGETPGCDSRRPSSCQVGDLSGKYGKISIDPFHARYVDFYTSLSEDSQAFIGNHALVIHYANKTRLTCANFVKVNYASNVTTTFPTATGPAPIQTGVSTSVSAGVSTLAVNGTSITSTGAPVASSTASATESSGPEPTGTLAPVIAAAPMTKLSLPLMGGAIAMVMFAL